MKRLFLCILSATILAASSFAQAPPAAPLPQPVAPAQPVKHGRGHVTPENIKQLVAASIEKHGKRLKALPKATASSYDIRKIPIPGTTQTKSVVSAAWDQGQCGSCWDFSGTRMVACALIYAGYFPPDGSGDLSPQYTLDCGRNGGCDGDDNTTVLAWAKTTGLPLSKDYGPYTARAGRCKDTSKMTLYKIADWGYCTTTGTDGVAAIQDIKNAIAAYGFVGCAVAAGNTPFWDSGNGTDTGRSNSIDHDIGIGGWDDDHDNGDGTKGAWLGLNSWGTGWGQEGWSWWKYDADSIGTQAVWCTVTALPPVPPPPGPTPPTPIPPGPTPVPPVPPTPGPTGNLGAGTLADGTQFVMLPNGVLVVDPKMTLQDFAKMLDQLKANEKPPCKDCDKLDALQKQMDEQRRAIDAILKTLLPPEKPLPGKMGSGSREPAPLPGPYNPD